MFTPATGSTMYVSANTSATATYIYDPLNNNDAYSSLLWAYGTGGSSGNGLNVLSNPTFPTCLYPYATYPRPSYIVTGSFEEGMAQEWIAQYGMWQNILLDNTYTSGYPELVDFANKAANSRYGWLSNIEAAIMSGDEATARTLLATDIDTYVDTTTDTTTRVVMQDGVAADYIVGNYVTLYNQYLKYMDTAMTGNDSAQVLAIASLCPYTNGNVVYQAQAFYRILFGDDTTQFGGNCGTDTATGAKGVNHNTINEANGKQQYQLYPNPNSGSFILTQSIAENGNVGVSVKDVLGRDVYSGNVLFVSGRSQLKLDNLTSGVYLMQLTDSNQKVSNFKFVVEK
jgi:hypothetical protein